MLDSGAERGDRVQKIPIKVKLVVNQYGYMTVIEQTEPQETLSKDESVLVELSDGMKLIEGSEKWIIRPPVDSGRRERHYQRKTDATLFMGLWVKTNGWTNSYPSAGSQMIPVDVVAAGKDAAAAYLRCGTGVVNSREAVARMLDVSEQTVSNYWNRVRSEVGQ